MKKSYQNHQYHNSNSNIGSNNYVVIEALTPKASSTVHNSLNGSMHGHSKHNSQGVINLGASLSVTNTNSSRTIAI